MKDLKQENEDLVSAILDNTELLNTFVNSLKDPAKDPEDEALNKAILQEENLITTERGQRIKYFVWKKIKDVLSFISTKIQTLAVLAEYNFKNLEKRIQLSMNKK